MNSKPVKGEQGPDGPSSAKRSKIPNKSPPPPEGAAGGDWDWDSKGLMVAGEGLGILLKREDGNRKFGHLEKFVTKEKGRTCVDTSNVIGTICLIKKGSVIRKEEGNLVSVGKGAIMDIMVVKKLEIPAGMLKERWIPGVGFVNEEDEETAESVDSEVSLEGDE